MVAQFETWYEFLLQQMASESYLESIDFANIDLVRAALQRGNNRLGFSERGATHFTDAQIDEFLGRFRIIAQASDNPTAPRGAALYYQGTTILANTGLSVTLIQNKQTNELTLSIRSTEYQKWVNGGDRERDGFGADIGEIFGKGFALAQLDALDRYYDFLKTAINPATGTFYLPAGSTLNVTGYSLGAHLATLFTELHSNEIQHTYTFNGPGRGTWDATQGDLSAMLDYYRALLANPDFAGVPSREDLARYNLYARAKATGDLDYLNIYRDPRYKWAAEETQRRFQTVGLGSPSLISADPARTGLSNGADAKITQIYGREFPAASEGVANSGVHGPASGVFIEAQPFLEGWPSFAGGAADFGNGHSIVLIADSLAVMRAFQQLDPALSLETANQLLAGASNKRAASSIFGSGGDATAEDDALENGLDALRRLFLGATVLPTEFKTGGSGFADLTSRNGFHANLKELTESPTFVRLVGKASIMDLTSRSADQMLQAATEDVAYRYALKALNPFAVLDAQRTGLYARWEAGGANAGELEPYDPVRSPAGLTQEYLQDRAAFLERKSYITTLNLDSFYQDPIRSDRDVFPNAPDERGKAYQREARNYQDLASGFIASTGGNRNALQNFIFGADGADAVQGAGEADHLYGGGGPDVLVGGRENDRIEGGAGFDTYRFAAGDGADTILDADGKGALIRDGRAISLGIKRPSGGWALGSTTFTVGESGADLNVTFAGTNDKLTLKDFNVAAAQAASYDGIRLIDVSAMPTNAANTYIGDTHTEKNDSFIGSVASELFLTGDGDDVVFADGSSSATSEVGGNDLIKAGANRDTVYGGAGSDWVEGGLAGDIIAGNDGNDVLYAEDSNDAAFTLDQAIGAGESAAALSGAGDLASGDGGDDVVIGVGTDDLLLGGIGSDVIVGGGGGDTIYGDGTLAAASLDWALKRQVIQSGTIFKVSLDKATISGNDASGGMDVIYGGTGDDWAFAGNGNDYIEGGQGKDVLFGEQGADVLFGGDENDVLVGDNLNSGGIADAGDDYLDGGAGNDLLQGDAGNDILVGGLGDDILSGGAGKDTYIFSAGDGRDQIFDDSAGAEASVLVFGEGFDRNALTIRPGSMLLDFGAVGSVDLASFDHFDPNAPAPFERLVFADGSALSFRDVLGRGFTILGTDYSDNGNDAAQPVLVGTGFKDSVYGLAGDDILVGLQGDDLVDGGAGADQLQGGDGNDRLLGDEGDDALFGMSGDDNLDGGAGWDWLLGGPGNDTYVYGAGDTLYDMEGQATIAFGPGVSASDVLLQRQPTGFRGVSVFSIALKSDLTPVEEAGLPFLEHELNVSLAADDQLAAFLFADGTVLDRAELLRQTWIDPAVVAGTDASDTLEGYAGNDFLRGGDGDDVLSGLAGSDRLEGGSGNDLLDGGRGDDNVLGGAGDDTLLGTAGTDTLSGGEGSDLYSYARGDGEDVISEEGDATSTDVLQFTDIASAEVTFSRRAGGDLVATIMGGGSVAVSGYYSAASSKIERVEFSDGAFVESSYLDTLSVPPITGTDGDDVLVGTPYEDMIEADAGNDILDGRGGNDVLAGGPGIDIYLLRPNGNSDVLVEDGLEQSVIQIDAGWDFADTRTARQGDDLVLTLQHANSNVTLPGYYIGQVNWLVRDSFGAQKTVAQLVDYLSSVTSPTSVSAWRQYFIDVANQQYRAYLARFGANGGVTIDDQGFSDAPVIYRDAPYSETGSYPTFHLNIADIRAGDSANVLDFRGSDSVIADAGGGDDLIDNQGQAFVSSSASIGSFLYGGDGNDSILGTWQADTLLGGSGDNYLAGSDGNDTYVVLSSDAGTTVIDEVNDYLSIGGHTAFAGGRYSTDMLVFADIPYSSVSIREGQFDTTATSPSGYGQLFRTLDFSWGTDAVVRLLVPDPRNPYIAEFLGESYGVESIKFSDGAVIPQSSLLNLVNPALTTGVPGSDATEADTDGDGFVGASFNQKTTLLGLEGDDFVSGGSQNDVLDGGPGNDYLYDDYGDDVLIGGEGDDRLRGSWGNDVLDGGLGNDLLEGGPGSDIYLFDPGFGRDFVHDDTLPFRIDTDTIRFGQGISATDVVVTRDDNDLYLIVGSDRIDIGYVFFWGTVNNPYQYTGVEAVEFSDGTSWSRAEMFARITTVPPSEFDDPVWGTDAAETFHGLTGDDRMSVFGGDDLVYGDEGDDFIDGGAGIDILFGGSGDDDIEDWATPQANFIHAGRGDDYVYIDTSRNFIIGGTGTDFIDVWSADSVLAFDRGDGQDTAFCAEEFTLSLGGGIASSDLTLEADGADVILRTGGGDYVHFARNDTSGVLHPWPALRLQIIGDEVRVYDFLAVIHYFDQQAVTQPDLVLSLGSVLPGYQLQSTLGQAYGGDLAYAYAKGRLDENVAATTVLPVISDNAFGIAAQSVTNPDGPPITGADKSSVVLGTNANEQIIGGAGSDWLNAGPGNDTLIGGESDDLLFGGPGSDTYVYHIGDGTDTVFDPEGENAVVFGAGIDPSTISLGVGSLFVRVGTGGIHFESFDPGNPYGPRDAERFLFADGTTVTYDALIDRGFDLFGTAGADVITGTATVDRIHGGRGDDLLTGASGGDTYFYERGDGADTIVESGDPSAVDGLLFGEGITPDSVRVGRTGDDLVATFAAPGDSITLKDWYGVSGPEIENIRFADGTVWDAAYLQGQAQTNRSPVLARPIGERRADEDAAFAFTLPADTFVDPDSGDTLTYSAVLSDGTALPAWLAFENGRFSGVPANADVGQYDVRLTATDTGGALASDQFVLSVDNVNDAPLAYDDATSIDEDSAVAITVAALLANDTDEDVGDAIRMASVSQSSAAGASVTLLADDVPHGLTPRVVYDPGAAFQHLAHGARADDAFTYSVADTAGAMSSATVHVSVIGENDAPVALADVALAQEDALTAVSGNVLRNDLDVDDDTVLSVPSAGTRAGRYGTLMLATNGEYSYVLDNASSAVQSLRNGQLALDAFDYTVSDGIDRSTGTLAVSVLGENDAPLLAREMSDVSLTAGQPFIFRISPGTFTDADVGDTLLFSATLADDRALPAWLNFDPATQSFSGTAQTGSFHLQVSATDQAGAKASGAFTIHAGVTVVGGDRNEHFSGTYGDDYLFGGAGNDHLSGAAGNDILQGGTGNDALMNEAGNGLLDGGSGNDTLTGAAGNEFYAGGAGNDVLHLGSGFNVVSFNSGDGHDVVYSSSGTNVLSLGGSRLDYANLRLEKSSQDLILHTGAGDQITFKDWYQGTDKQQMVDLQVIADAMTSFDGVPSDSWPTAVQHFDFRGLVQAFDTARATSGVTSWALSNALNQFHLGGSDSEAYGGDLAYWYARKGNLAGISVAAAQQIIGAPGFGADAQSLRPFLGLDEGFTKLS